MKLRLLVILLLGIFCSTNLDAQRSKDWQQSNDQKNRYEGTYTRKVSNPSIKLVSLIAYQEGYEFGQQQNLNIRFYSPNSIHYKLKAEELRVSRFYWMEDKNTQTSTGWNTFSGWPVDYLLRRLSISYRNLGILVQLGGAASRDFAPVYAYHNTFSENPSRYVASFQLGRSASGGSFSLFKGKGRSQALLLKKKPISRKSGGTSFPIVLSADLLKGRGWYTVEVNLREKGTLDPFSYSFSFYHAN